MCQNGVQLGVDLDPVRNCGSPRSVHHYVSLHSIELSSGVKVGMKGQDPPPAGACRRS